jgi:hypothetical protein
VGASVEMVREVASWTNMADDRAIEARADTAADAPD